MPHCFGDREKESTLEECPYCKTREGLCGEYIRGYDVQVFRFCLLKGTVYTSQL